jgi:hypothetical protein
LDLALLQDAHRLGWKLVNDFLDANYPIVTMPTSRLNASLSSKIAPFLDGVFGGVYRPEEQVQVLWLNMVTMGVPGSVKTDWCLSYLTDTLQRFPKSAVAVVLLTNQAGDGCKLGAQSQQDSEERIKGRLQPLEIHICFIHFWPVQGGATDFFLK